MAKFNISRTLTFSSYIGGSSKDYCTGIAYDASTGGVVVTGTAASTTAQGFPIVNSGNPTLDDDVLNGSSDLFIAKFSSSGTLLRSRYFGGDGAEFTDTYSYLNDKSNPCNGVSVDAEGNIFIAGTSTSGLPTFWPTPQPPWYFSTYTGTGETGPSAGDAFIAAFAPSLKREYCSYYGSSATDNGTDIAVTRLLNSGEHCIVMVGKTQIKDQMDDYPTRKEHDNSYFSAAYFKGTFDGIITKIYTNSFITGLSQPTLPNTAVMLSPNPCRDVLYLSIDGSCTTDQATVFVHDASGRFVQQTAVSLVSDKCVINTHYLPAGNYFVTVDLSTGRWSGKFVKSPK